MEHSVSLLVRFVLTTSISFIGGVRYYFTSCYSDYSLRENKFKNFIFGESRISNDAVAKEQILSIIINFLTQVK